MQQLAEAVLLICSLIGDSSQEGTGIAGQATQLLLRALNSASSPRKCIEGIGCFGTGGPFYHLVHRPINVLPDDRHQINTKYLLYTKHNPNEAQLLIPGDARALNESFFGADIDTKVIVHGFMDSLEIGKWIHIMKDEFLKHGDYNVIVVDWSGGNGPSYVKATANSRVVGAELALLINFIRNTTGSPAEKFHIIGHSLGAQIGGYAGERVQDMGRITGLDPAGPYFFNMPREVRLDPSDAKFVDVIHSDASLPHHLLTHLGIFADKGFGIDQLVGHVDFYPNNGNNQPGCRLSHINSLLLEGMLESVRRLTACDHQRSVDFFTSTINTRLCLPVGAACKTWEDFAAGRCGGCASGIGKCAAMGFLADRMRRLPRGNTPVKLFLKTNPDPPFCLFQYQIIVKTTRSVPLWDLFGEVLLTLPGVGQKASIRMNKSRLYSAKPGAKYTSLLATKSRLYDVQNVTFHWKTPAAHDAAPVPRIWYFKIRPLDLHMTQKRARNPESWVFCSNASVPLVPGDVFVGGANSCSLLDVDDEWD